LFTAFLETLSDSQTLRPSANNVSVENLKNPGLVKEADNSQITILVLFITIGLLVLLFLGFLGYLRYKHRWFLTQSEYDAFRKGLNPENRHLQFSCASEYLKFDANYELAFADLTIGNPS